MPQNKRESLIYSVMMCFFMVFVMSVYNVSLHSGFSFNSVKEGWIGMPVAFCVAIFFDMLIVSKIAKTVAFGFILKPNSKTLTKIITISSIMVIQMAVIMSFYGATEMCLKLGSINGILSIWAANIPKNFIAALPIQLFIAGPLIRFLFRKVFPVGSVN